jgi:hypothetical protein
MQSFLNICARPNGRYFPKEALQNMPVEVEAAAHKSEER